MTRDWYVQHGFKMSAQLDANEIDRAESDVETAYIKPIMNVATEAPSSSVVENTTSNLSSVIYAKRELCILLKDMGKYDAEVGNPCQFCNIPDCSHSSLQFLSECMPCFSPAAGFSHKRRILSASRPSA